MNEKNLTPSEEEQQWLKDLFASVPAQQEPEAVPPEITAEDEEEQWLKDLFASAELAAEQALASDLDEQEQTSDEDLLVLDWPEPASETITEESAVVPQEQPAAVAEPVNVTDLDQFLQEIEAATNADPFLEETAVAEVPAPVPAEQQAVTQPVQETEEDPNAALRRNPAFTAKDAQLKAQEADEEEEQEEQDNQAPHKRRPKKKDGYGLFGLPHIVVTAIWLFIIVAIGGFLGNWLWNGASDVLAFGREDKVVTITISESDDLDAVIDKLHNAGLINEPTWFRLYAKITDAMEDIDAGTFQLNTLYDYHALVTHMSTSSAARVTVNVVIPEGYTCAQIFDLLESKGVCSAAALEEAAAQEDLSDYWFLEDLSLTGKYRLEGYLFPDTYTFYVGDKADRVLHKLLSNFETRFVDSMKQKLDVLNEALAETLRKNGMSESYIAEHAITVREAVIIASLIEKETSGVAEGYIISSVIYNRLSDPNDYPYLNIDAALVYITGNRTLTDADKAIDSPYNTYLYPGLIPGPICSPGLSSLNAALDPDDTDYYFYALNPETMEHHFSKTLKEHQAFLDSLPKEETNSP